MRKSTNFGSRTQFCCVFLSNINFYLSIMQLLEYSHKPERNATNHETLIAREVTRYYQYLAKMSGCFLPNISLNSCVLRFVSNERKQTAIIKKLLFVTLVKGVINARSKSQKTLIYPRLHGSLVCAFPYTLEHAVE